MSSSFRRFTIPRAAGSPSTRGSWENLISNHCGEVWYAPCVPHRHFFDGNVVVIIHRIINRDTYWTQILVVGDVHLLDTDSRLDLAVGGGFGDSILAKKQGIGLIFRVTSNYWMTERLGLSLSGNFIHVVGLDDPSSHPSFSAGGMNAGLKYRF